MLEDKKFDDVSRIINKQPNLINSMRGEWGWTFLMKAAYYKRKDIVGYLSNQQHDLSVVSDGGSNVLHHIVWFNDDDVAFELLNSLEISQLNDDVINKQNKYKQTPLHYAAMKNKHKSIVWLMDQGADPSLKDVVVCVLMKIVVVLMKQKTSFETSKNGEKVFYFFNFIIFFSNEIFL